MCFPHACSFGLRYTISEARFYKSHLERAQGGVFECLRRFWGNLVEFEGEDDHVHLLIEYPPKVAVSKLVNSLKGVSSRRLRPSPNQAFRKLYGEIISGPRVILQVHAEAHRFLQFSNILSAKSPLKSNEQRPHSSLGGKTPNEVAREEEKLTGTSN